ncbi:carboxylesterase [Psychromicrobium silvestre]|uniref:Carboxylesterase n=1 Tax=Psychromicrobium silvestre TaxID=1645614 RepID=A0A7Y9S3P7_9MICC|nr:alpha/beta fold hydrolase [Psychromicrobium silvestre]NYE93949.1 carboxylesterase [Psychromicrobium silvestre]
MHEPLISAGRGELSRMGVVVTHGFTGSPESMRPWAEDLAAQGFAVNMPLLPGHGTSWQELSQTPWQQWYTGVEAAYLELASRCELVFAAGLSMGGALSLRLAEHHQLAGLALVNPGLTAADPRARFAGLLKHFVKSVPAIGNDIVKPGVEEHAYPRTPVASVHQLNQLFRDTTAGLAKVNAPTIVFRSTVDHVVPDSSLRAIQKGISSKDLRIVKLANSYHVATLDHDAPEIFAQSSAFFKEIAGV